MLYGLKLNLRPLIAKKFIEFYSHHSKEVDGLLYQLNIIG